MSHIVSLGPDAHLEVWDDRIAVRCPQHPEYPWGNCLLFRSSHNNADSQIAQFRADFANAHHTAIFWDDPDGRSASADESFRERGFVINELHVLVRDGPAFSVPQPAQVTFKEVASDAEWEEVTRLQCATTLEDGQDAARHLPLMTQRMAERRRGTSAGHLVWFGAFRDGHLIADLGVILADKFFRFQAVETRASCRRRGIASALVSYASHHVDAISPGKSQLIIADAKSDAGRIYRMLGFECAERIVTALRAAP